MQGTFGAQLHKDLDIRPISAIFRKGMNPEIDSYSAFFDNNKLNNTGLHGFLQDKGITELVFCGLAGDFCVAYSANDAKALGYKVSLAQIISYQREGATVKEGIQVSVFDFDSDENNNPDNLLADGIVVLNETGTYTNTKWLIKVLPNEKYGKYYWVSDTKK